MHSMQFADLGVLAPPGMKAAVESALAEIIESEQFRRSQRSRLFLQTIVQKALVGDVESLKERILGIELFGRDPMFDTDRDSVVRVAANDVRNRLTEYYRNHPGLRIQISLPAGHYVPSVAVRPEAALVGTAPPSLVTETVAAATQTAPPAAVSAAAGVHAIAQPPRRKRLSVASAVAVMGLIGMGFWALYRSPGAIASSSAITSLPPWSALVAPDKRISLVLADANLVAATVRLDKDIPIEQYAGHKFNYLPDVGGQFGAYLNQIPLTTVSDAAIATRITELATRGGGGGVQVKYSSRLDVSALKGDDPLVLVGSPTSNPWVQLFYDRLNFQLVHKFENGMDICINRRPQPGELATYIPERNPAGVSEGYALIALVPNLTGKAGVLIIAGTSTEATEAAGDFVVNLNELSAGIKPLLARVVHPQHLELLIKTSFVSGSAARSEVLAYRIQ